MFVWLVITVLICFSVFGGFWLLPLYVISFIAFGLIVGTYKR